ncbi:MAG: glutamate racemase [Sediminispirochaetaceae bacterium]
MKPKESQPVVVFDSGVGGLPYLQQLREMLPGEFFAYVADTAYFPYGEKRADELTSILHTQMRLIIERLNPKLVVVACNTASVVALSGLRDAFGIPFVGVVPAVKPAAEGTINGNIGLLATRKTVEDPYTDRLEEQFASHCRVYRFAGVDIVDLVEHRFFTASRREVERILQPGVEFFLSREIDHLILACTHFIFMEEELKKALGSRVKIVDSREGVARQTARILEREKRRDKSGGVKQGRFYVTAPADTDTYKRFSEMFQLIPEGVL